MSEISEDKMKKITHRCLVALKNTVMNGHRRLIMSINCTAVLWEFPRENCHVRAGGDTRKFMSKTSFKKNMYVPRRGSYLSHNKNNNLNCCCMLVPASVRWHKRPDIFPGNKMPCPGGGDVRYFHGYSQAKLYLCCVALEHAVVNIDRRTTSINCTAVLWKFPRESCHVRAGGHSRNIQEKTMSTNNQRSCEA